MVTKMANKIGLISSSVKMYVWYLLYVNFSVKPLNFIYPSLVVVQPRKTSPFITEGLLMGRKESNQTKPLNFAQKWSISYFQSIFAAILLPYQR